MQIFRTWIFVCLLAISAAPASSYWAEIRSDKFVYQGDVEPESATALLGQLEIFRSSVVSAVGGDPDAVSLPVRIFAVTRASEVAAVLPNSENFSVLSENHVRFEGPVFLVHSDIVEGRQSSDYFPLLRGLARHFIRESAPDQYPYWMQSGLADYWAGSRFEERRVIPGQAIEAFDYPLSRGRWVSMKSIFNSRTAADFDAMDSISGSELSYSAQSWAAVHFILSSPDLSARIADYLDRLDKGQPPHKAFKRAFRLSPRKLEKRLKMRTISQAKTKTHTSLNALTPQFRLAARRLGEGEAAIAKAQLLEIFALTDEGFNLAITQYKNSCSALEQRAMGLAGQAEIYRARGEIDRSQDLMSEAVSLAPKEAAFHKMAGSFYVSNFKTTGELQWLDAARIHFETALRPSVSDPFLDASYASVCAQIDCAGHEDVRSAQRALAFFRDASYIDHNFAMLPLLDEAGEFDDIINFAEFASVWGESAETRSRATAILQAVKRKKPKR